MRLHDVISSFLNEMNALRDSDSSERRRSVVTAKVMTSVALIQLHNRRARESVRAYDRCLRAARQAASFLGELRDGEEMKLDPIIGVRNLCPHLSFFFVFFFLDT